MTKTQQKIPPTLKPSSRRDLEAKRRGVMAVGPSGSTYRLRKINTARRFENGDVDLSLKRIALKAIDTSFGQPRMNFEALSDDDRDTLIKSEEQQRDQNDRLVLATVIEPPLSPEDLGTGELDDDPVLPSVDYDWLLGVAQGKFVADAEGRYLWGPPPRNLLDVFQKHHGCADDCEHCADVVTDFTAPVAAA